MNGRFFAVIVGCFFFVVSTTPAFALCTGAAPGDCTPDNLGVPFGMLCRNDKDCTTVKAVSGPQKDQCVAVNKDEGVGLVCGTDLLCSWGWGCWTSPPPSCKNNTCITERGRGEQ